MNPKVLSPNTVASFCEVLRKSGKNIVFTNGCFDLLHPGHLDYLNKAKQLGDVLIVGVNSDESIQRLKGKNRPINNMFFRLEMLSGLACVDYVVAFSEDTPEHLIQQVNPNFLVKGGDYQLHEIVGAKFVQSQKGEVKIIPFLDGFSSTSIISKIQSLT